MTPEGWRKIDRGLFESADGQWRIANPWRLTTELRHRWLVAERSSSGSGWCMHDGDHAYESGPAGPQSTSQRSRARLSGAARQGRADASRESGALDRLDRRSYAGPTGGDVAVVLRPRVVLARFAGRAAAAGPEGVSP